MRWPPSTLAVRLTIALGVFQSLFLVASLMFGPGIVSQLGLGTRATAAMHADLLEDALELEAGKPPRLRPSAELEEFLSENPEAWHMVTALGPATGGGTHRVGEVGTLNRPGEAREATPGAEERNAPYTWILQRPDGEVLLTVGGHRRSRDKLVGLLGYTGLQILLSIAMTMLIVHHTLGPVRRAARMADTIMPAGPRRSLPMQGLVREIAPFVTAVNDAIDRLADAHERQHRFVANAAHELRTPVTTLRLRLDQLADGTVKADLLRDLRGIALLVDQLLDLERLQSEAVAMQAVDLAALARDAAEDLAPLAIDAGAAIELEVPEGPVLVLGEEQALRSAVLNLVFNGIIHGGAGSTTRIAVQAGAVLLVEDDGPGIPPAARERIFEPFQRNSKARGSGLGLYIVQQILQSHGGTIRVGDGPDGGASFRIDLGEAAQAIQAGSAPEKSGSLSGAAARNAATSRQAESAATSLG